MTPTEEYSQTHVAIATQPEISPDYDVSSMFLTYPGVGGSEEYGVLKPGRADESCFIKQHGGHCGCLHESSNYNAVLELSIRLRKAADILARSPNHHIGSTCLLNQRISDLDTFTTKYDNLTRRHVATKPRTVSPRNRPRSESTIRPKSTPSPIKNQPPFE
ncbi:hypothetical protein H0H81_002924 [Sphagnurus paluster]|uniref:Uncharacterized protein n=1 Tax=Sphagnurus paluster TaxID=117069 RepID=A0A9P7FVG9_9AGAR|nr:hypothetical protein H0H81_002924 [Sphagnurus paluster]